MIIYGSRNKQLAKENIFEKCPNCGTQNCIDMHVFQKYAHVFWIPMFPMGKNGVSQCDHCKQVLTSAKMPSFLRTAYENLKAQTKTPIWMFIGLVGFVTLFGIAGYQVETENAHSKKYIKALQINDILHTEVEGGFTTLKVVQISADSIFFKYNQNMVNKESGIYKLQNDTASFDEEIQGASKQEIVSKFKEGEIIKVMRE